MWPVHALVEPGGTLDETVTCATDHAVLVKDYDKLHAFHVNTVGNEEALAGAVGRFVDGNGHHNCLVVRCGGGSRHRMVPRAVQMLYDAAAQQGGRQPAMMAAAARGAHELVDLLSPQRTVHSKAAIRTGAPLLTRVEYTPSALAATIANIERWEEPTVAAISLSDGGAGHFTVLNLPRPGDHVEVGIALRSIRKGSCDGVTDRSSRCKVLPVLVHELTRGLPVEIHVVAEVDHRAPPADVLPALRFSCELSRQTLIAPKEIDPQCSVEAAAAGYVIVAADTPRAPAARTSPPRAHTSIHTHTRPDPPSSLFAERADPPLEADTRSRPPPNAAEDAAWAQIMSSAAVDSPRLGGSTHSAAAGSALKAQTAVSPISKLAAAIATEVGEGLGGRSAAMSNVSRPSASMRGPRPGASFAKDVAKTPPSSLAKRLAVPSAQAMARALPSSVGAASPRGLLPRRAGAAESIDRTLAARDGSTADQASADAAVHSLPDAWGHGHGRPQDVRRHLDVTGLTEDPAADATEDEGFTDFLRVWDREAMEGVGALEVHDGLQVPTAAERRAALIAEIDRLRRQREQQDGRLERMQDAAVKVKEENLSVAHSIRQTQTMNTKLEYEIRRLKLDYERLQETHMGTLRLLQEEKDKRKEVEQQLRVQKDKEIARLRDSVGKRVRSPMRTTQRERANEAALCGELRLEIVKLKKENTGLRKKLAGGGADTKQRLEQHQKVLEVLHERVRRSESEVAQLELEKVAISEQKESLSRELAQVSQSRDKMLEALKSQQQQPPAEAAQPPSVLQSSVKFLLAATTELLSRAAGVLHSEGAQQQQPEQQDTSATEVLVATVESIELLESTLMTLSGEAERGSQIGGLSRIKPAVAEEMERLTMLTDILETAQQLHLKLKTFEA